MDSCMSENPISFTDSSYTKEYPPMAIVKQLDRVVVKTNMVNEQILHNAYLCITTNRCIRNHAKRSYDMA